MFCPDLNVSGFAVLIDNVSSFFNFFHLFCKYDPHRSVCAVLLGSQAGPYLSRVLFLG